MAQRVREAMAQRVREASTERSEGVR